MGDAERGPNNICHDALMGNRGVCFDDCDGRVAQIMVGQTAKLEGVAVDVCPRESMSGKPPSGRGDYCNNAPDPMVIYSRKVPTLEEVEAIVADAY